MIYTFKNRTSQPFITHQRLFPRPQQSTERFSGPPPKRIKQVSSSPTQFSLPQTKKNFLSKLRFSRHSPVVFLDPYPGTWPTQFLTMRHGIQCQLSQHLACCILLLALHFPIPNIPFPVKNSSHFSLRTFSSFLPRTVHDNKPCARSATFLSAEFNFPNPSVPFLLPTQFLVSSLTFTIFFYPEDTSVLIILHASQSRQYLFLNLRSPTLLNLECPCLRTTKKNIPTVFCHPTAFRPLAATQCSTVGAIQPNLVQTAFIPQLTQLQVSYLSASRGCPLSQAGKSSGLPGRRSRCCTGDGAA